MKSLVVDYRISEKSLNTLKNLGYKIIKTQKETSVSEAICGHPDIVLCKLKNHDCVAETTFCGFLADKTECNVIEGKSLLKKDYPFDIAYNAALVGNNLFCNEKYTDISILNYCKDNDIKLINVNQGYAKCSICVVSDNAIITADKSIFKTSLRNNIDALLIENKGIVLKGYEVGFFGGATGLIEKNLLAVNGNISLHMDCNRILQFCSKYGVTVLSLSDEPIYDVGTIIRL